MFISLIINAFHILLVLFTIIAPFIDRPGILLLHIVHIISLLTHWYFNNNSCCLTLLEKLITGKETADTFMHKLISPIYDISETSLNNIVWVVTLSLLLMSSYKLYKYLNSLEKIELIDIFDTQLIKN